MLDCCRAVRVEIVYSCLLTAAMRAVLATLGRQPRRLSPHERLGKSETAEV
jgi:hypothetical protein